MLVEIFRLGFEFADDGVEVEAEIGRAVGQCRVVFLAGGLDGIEGEAKVFENALADFEAAESFAAGPVKKAVQVATLGELQHDLGHIFRRGGLADLVAKELRALARANRGQQLLVQAALATGAVAHKDGDAQNDRIVRIVLQHFAFRHKLGLAVEVSGGGHVGRAVGGLRPAVEDHVGGNVDQARPEVPGELGEVPGEGDVNFFRQGGLGLDGCGVGDGGAVDDHIRPEFQAEPGEWLRLAEVHLQAAVEPVGLWAVLIGQADYIVTTTHGSLGVGVSEESGGSGEKNLHKQDKSFCCNQA